MVRIKLSSSLNGILSWLVQRITSIIMLVVLIAIIIGVFILKFKLNNDLHSWQQLFDDVLVKVILQLFFISLSLHAWVGVRDILMDYIQNVGIKLWLYILSIIWLVVWFIYSFKVIWL